MCVCGVCVCVCVCVRACVTETCVRACVRACVCVCARLPHRASIYYLIILHTHALSNFCSFSFFPFVVFV